MKPNTIEITLERYAQLIKDSEFLSCLRACGVDNWGGYCDAQEMFQMEEDDE